MSWIPCMDKVKWQAWLVAGLQRKRVLCCLRLVVLSGPHVFVQFITTAGCLKDILGANVMFALICPNFELHVQWVQVYGSRKITIYHLNPESQAPRLKKKYWHSQHQCSFSLQFILALQSEVIAPGRKWWNRPSQEKWFSKAWSHLCDAICKVWGSESLLCDAVRAILTLSSHWCPCRGPWCFRSLTNCRPNESRQRLVQDFMSSWLGLLIIFAVLSAWAGVLQYLTRSLTVRSHALNQALKLEKLLGANCYVV